MSFMNSLENSILDHYVGNATWTADANIFWGLSTTTPTKVAGNFTEPVGNGYARVSTSATDYNSAATGSLDNANAITFAQATGSWGTVTYFGGFSLVTAGVLRSVGLLDTARAIGNGDTAEFAVGGLTIDFDQGL